MQFISIGWEQIRIIRFQSMFSCISVLTGCSERCSTNPTQHHEKRISRIYDLYQKVTKSSIFNTENEQLRHLKHTNLTCLNVSRQQSNSANTGMRSGCCVIDSIGIIYFCRYNGLAYHVTSYIDSFIESNAMLTFSPIFVTTKKNGRNTDIIDTPMTNISGSFVFRPFILKANAKEFKTVS